MDTAKTPRVRRFVYGYTEQQKKEMAKRFAAGDTLARLQEVFGGSYWAVVYVLEEAGVYEQRKRPGRPRRQWTDAEVKEMCAMWDTGASKSRIAHHFGMREATAHKLLEASGRKVEYRTGMRPGKEHTRWKGGRVLLSKGYIGILAEESDPIAWAMRRNVGYVPEHRLVMAHSLGRTLSDSETVHHLNGDRADNRIENLQLRHGEHGSGVVMRCRSCGSHDIESAPIGR